jgi:hypothetical protein
MCVSPTKDVQTDDCAQALRAEAYRRVPESLPTCMGADRQRAAGNASGSGESPDRVRPNKSGPWLRVLFAFS